MKSHPALTYKNEPYSPPIDRNFRGLLVAFSTSPARIGLSVLQVGISYSVDDSFVEKLGGKRPAEALVITVISGYSTFSANILGDALLFEDDYRRHENIWFGHVNLKLADYTELHSESEYYVTISMGALLSNTLHIPRGNSKLSSES